MLPLGAKESRGLPCPSQGTRPRHSSVIAQWRAGLGVFFLPRVGVCTGLLHGPAEAVPGSPTNWCFRQRCRPQPLPETGHQEGPCQRVRPDWLGCPLLGRGAQKPPCVLGRQREQPPPCRSLGGLRHPRVPVSRRALLLDSPAVLGCRPACPLPAAHAACLGTAPGCLSPSWWLAAPSGHQPPREGLPLTPPHPCCLRRSRPQPGTGILARLVLGAV